MILRGVSHAANLHCEDRCFLALAAGVKNTLGQGIRVKEIDPAHHARAFDGVGPKSDLQMLNGPGRAGIGTRMDVGRGETYKLVVATNGRMPAACSAQDATAEIKMINHGADSIAVISIDRKENGNVDWSVSVPDFPDLSTSFDATWRGSYSEGQQSGDTGDTCGLAYTAHDAWIP